jgi:hypothetical protein
MDICRIEDLDENQPEVAKALREHGEFFDDYYAYRLTKPRKIWVKRRWIGIYKFQGWKPIPYDHDAKKRNRNQTKLLEVKG